ncbi:MAG TPA: GntR family transcriptional regulator [Candidatus Binatia bacterium]|jgi:DNA-binding GntR family transcriptional regulator
MAKTSRAEKKFRSLTKLIAEELRGAILSGRMPAGERLSEEKLAASLKVSRVPLREALRRLEAQGYVTFASHSEIIISKPSVDEVEDYYAIAGVLEGLAARLAVERGTAEEISRLRELHQVLKEAYRNNDLQGYFDANSRFHGYIAEMARNERLYGLIQQLRQAIQKTRILALHLPQRLDYSMREHDQILDAFLKKNAELAQSVVLRHLNNQMTAIKAVLQSQG